MNVTAASACTSLALQLQLGLEVKVGPGKAHYFVPATLMQLLCSLCVLLQMFLSTRAGMQCEL